MLNRFVKLFALLFTVLFVWPVVAKSGDRPHTVFVVGEAEYGSEMTMPALAQVLIEQLRF